MDDDVDASKTGKNGLKPFQLLGLALDLLVETGVLPRERRMGAEYVAWSAVHGLAFLVIEGPLRGAPVQFFWFNESCYDTIASIFQTQ